jgi:5-aminolevulinate synthase
LKAKESANVSNNTNNMVCTDTISCPFFQKGNIDLSKMNVTRGKLHTDESIESEQRQERASKMIGRRMTSNNSKRSLTASDSDGESNSQAELKRRLATTSEEENVPLFDYERFFENKIEAKKKDGSYRNFKRIVRQAKTFPSVQELTKEAMRDVTVWCSNDYLGLGRHPYVQSRVSEAIWKYGVGSGGTRNISGSTPLHDKLEQELARLHQKEAALVFTSCYVANDTTLFTMAKMLPDCEILSDAGNHASMIQGIRNSNVPKHIFRHNDCEHLEATLKRLPVETPKIVAFETVHSMDGSICDLHRMCDITRKYGGISFVDEVHAVGLYGENGAGIGERDEALHKMDIISGTLGKAFGNIGGYIAGSARLVDTIRSYGSGFIFTTSLPPSVAAGALAAIEISRSDEGRELRAKQQYYAKLVKDRLADAGLPVMSSPSHIVPVMVGDVNCAGEICDRLLNEHGIYIQSINYPTVARGSERLRIVPNPHHSAEMVEKLISSLIGVWVKTGLKLMKSKNMKKSSSA